MEVGDLVGPTMARGWGWVRTLVKWEEVRPAEGLGFVGSGFRIGCWWWIGCWIWGSARSIGAVRVPARWERDWMDGVR